MTLTVQHDKDAKTFSVIPTCSYVDTYIKRHQDEYGPLLAR